MLQFQVFRGKREMFRSEKQEHKTGEVVKDTEDQWTKDQREYLGPELFAILQE